MSPPTPTAENGGTVSANKTEAAAYETVVITVKPESGYVSDGIIVLDKNGEKVFVTKKDNQRVRDSRNAVDLWCRSHRRRYRQYPGTQGQRNQNAGGNDPVSVLWRIYKVKVY